VKLRKRLQAYYRGIGRRDPVIISIPKGGYVPQFRLRSNNGSACRPARFVVSSGAASVENRLPGNHQPKIMLAVLPFEDLSGNEEDEYFSDGLTEELITELGRMNPERLGVIARTSAMKFKRSGKGIEQVNQELNANYVLEGTIRRTADLRRINARLIQNEAHNLANTLPMCPATFSTKMRARSSYIPANRSLSRS
jgi:TolB-like protein